MHQSEKVGMLKIEEEKMADFDEDAENDELLAQLFADSDNDEEFEGFELGNILGNIDILNEIDFDQSLNDQEMMEDVNIGWERNDAVPICAPFTGNPGLTVELPQNPEPIDIFNLLFKPEILDILTTRTNLYAENRIVGEQLKENSRLQKWKPVSID